MSDIDVEKLSYACSEAPAQSTQTLIAKGNLRWFYGKPVTADDAVVALMLANGARVSLAKADVVEVERDEGGYWIGVNDGTGLLVEVRLPGRAGDKCECSSQSGPVAQLGPKGGGDLPEPTPDPFCRIRWKCRWYMAPDGFLKYVCWPWIECLPRD